MAGAGPDPGRGHRAGPRALQDRRDHRRAPAAQARRRRQPQGAVPVPRREVAVLPGHAVARAVPLPGGRDRRADRGRHYPDPGAGRQDGAGPQRRRVWVEAPFRSYGVQRLMRLTLTRNGRTKVVHATDEHRWFVPSGALRQQRREKLTKDLQPGDRLSSAPTCGPAELGPRRRSRGARPDARCERSAPGTGSCSRSSGATGSRRSTAPRCRAPTPSRSRTTCSPATASGAGRAATSSGSSRRSTTCTSPRRSSCSPAGPGWS